MEKVDSVSSRNIEELLKTSEKQKCRTDVSKLKAIANKKLTKAKFNFTNQIKIFKTNAKLDQKQNKQTFFSERNKSISDFSNYLRKVKNQNQFKKTKKPSLKKNKILKQKSEMKIENAFNLKYQKREKTINKKMQKWKNQSLYFDEKKQNKIKNKFASFNFLFKNKKKHSNKIDRIFNFDFKSRNVEKASKANVQR